MTSVLTDFLPLLAFYAAFWAGGIYVATGVGMAASVLSVGWLLWRRKPVRPMAWVSALLVIVLGAATLVLHDEQFIKLKPTALYWLFAVLLLGLPRLAGRNPIQGLLGGELRLPERQWRHLNDAWGVFFAALGGLNLYVANHYPTATWATFKVFGTLGLMLVFVVLQGIVLAPHLQQDESKP